MSSYSNKQLVTAWTDVHGGIAPDAATQAQLQLRTNASFSDKDAMAFVLNSADNSTALAALSYQFFTGKSPTKDGLAYLVHSDANDRDLNDPYYAKLGLTDRYINFSANLGIVGEGKETFAANYGAMNMNDFVASIYETIIGSTYARAAGKDPQEEIRYTLLLVRTAELTAESAGLINSFSTAAERDLATKATLAGYLLGEAIKSDVGIYAGAANNFMLAVATGTATYNTDITTTYAPTTGQGAGQTVTTAPPVDTVVGYEPPTPPVPDPVAHSFTLTTGTDSFTGESLADTFTGTLGTSATLNANDVLRGAGGDDTLTITSDAGSSFSYDASKITDIEHLRVTATGGATFQYLDGIAFTDLTNTGSTVDVHFNEAAATSNLKISSTTASTFFETPNTGLSGSTDAMTLTLSDVTGAAGVTINDGAGSLNQYETLNIVSNGTANAIKLGTDTHQTSLATINISGAAPLTLTFAAGGDHIVTSATTIDSHTATGGVTIGSLATALGAANHTITLGTGRNVVFFGDGVLNTNDTVTATASTNDTLVLTGATGVTSADLAHVTGIETFRFMNTSGTLTQDVTQLPGGVTLEIDGTDSSVLFNNLANNATINALNAFNLKMALANDTGSDALTVNITPATTAGANLKTITNVTGLETLNLVSNGATGQTAANVIQTDNVTNAHVLTGSADLTITNAIKTASFDASAFTGALTITAQLASATTIMGGSGADSITLGRGADTVDAGAGNDTIYLATLGTTVHASRGADTIATGAGNDTVVFVDNLANGTGAGDYTSQAKITDFHVGASTADTDILAFVGDDSVYSLAGATGLAKGATAKALATGDAMVLQTFTATGSATAAITDVSFIKLTDPTPFSADIKTTFAAAIGTSVVTGLAVDGNYVISLFDNAIGRMVVAIVNVGHDGILEAGDFTNASVALIGTVTMTQTEYDNFGATHLGAVL